MPRPRLCPREFREASVALMRASTPARWTAVELDISAVTFSERVDQDDIENVHLVKFLNVVPLECLATWLCARTGERANVRSSRPNVAALRPADAEGHHRGGETPMPPPRPRQAGHPRHNMKVHVPCFLGPFRVVGTLRTGSRGDSRYQ